MKKTWWVIFCTLIILLVVFQTLIIPPSASGSALIVGLVSILLSAISTLVLMLTSKVEDNSDREYSNNTSFVLSLIHILLQTLAMYVMGAIQNIPIKLVTGIHIIILVLFVMIHLLLVIGLEGLKSLSNSEQNSFVTRMKHEFSMLVSSDDNDSSSLYDDLKQLINSTPYESHSDLSNIEYSILDTIHAASESDTIEHRNQLLKKAQRLLMQRNKAL